MWVVMGWLGSFLTCDVVVRVCESVCKWLCRTMNMCDSCCMGLCVGVQEVVWVCECV